MGGRVITVTSGKGGVGKTTTTANLGVALARNNQKVVLIDADIGLRNLDIVMGLENRIVFLDGVINDGVANLIVMKLLFLQSENRHQDVHLYVNSPGGSVTATMAIYDTMQFLECDVATYCVGLAASGGVFYHEETPEKAAEAVQQATTANPDIGGWCFIGGWPLFTTDALKWEQIGRAHV